MTHFQMGSVCRFPRVVLALGVGEGRKKKKKRDFIEHINLNVVTASSCLIKRVHIIHIHFFPAVPRRVSQRTRSLGRAGCEERDRLRLCRGRCLFFSHCWLPPLDYFTAADLSPLLIFDSLAALSTSAPSSVLSPFAVSQGGEITGYEGNV